MSEDSEAYGAESLLDVLKQLCFQIMNITTGHLRRRIKNSLFMVNGGYGNITVNLLNKLTTVLFPKQLHLTQIPN
jgi:hypothetical protein